MAKINFQPDNVTHEVTDGICLIDACDSFKDVTLSFGCTEGTCGICELTVISGENNCSRPSENEIDYLYPEDIELGMRLGCQLKILTGEVKITWKSNRSNKNDKPFPKSGY